jgi:hypothetical protein
MHEGGSFLPGADGGSVPGCSRQAEDMIALLRSWWHPLLPALEIFEHLVRRVLGCEQ